MNTNIIAIANQKGGKTTTTTNLGVGPANAGEKVLLVDCDPQASLAISLGYPQPDKLPCTLSTLMGSVIQVVCSIPMRDNALTNCAGRFFTSKRRVPMWQYSELRERGISSSW